ncbi:MAG: hypothetical protein ACK559_00105, partial [bacterium]
MDEATEKADVVVLSAVEPWQVPQPVSERPVRPVLLAQAGAGASRASSGSRSSGDGGRADRVRIAGAYPARGAAPSPGLAGPERTRGGPSEQADGPVQLAGGHRGDEGAGLE